MKTITTEMIADATKGVSNKYGEVTSVVIDNREVVPGCLFVAIVGERFDGHDFISSAVLAGAAAVMISKELSPEVVKSIEVPIIRVNETRKALLDLASTYRKTFGVGIEEFPVIALTGSVGKTTTKEMIWCVVNSEYNAHKTYMNWNNDIGVPRVLLGLEPTNNALVVEMGMDHKGEISSLTRAVLPDVAVVTNVGVSHIENLGSRENILKAKLEIVEGLSEGSALILNEDNDLLSTVEPSDFDDKYRIAHFGIKSQNLDVRATDIKYDRNSTSFKVEVINPSLFKGISLKQPFSFNISLPTTGEHNVYNALAASCVGFELGISSENISKSLNLYKPAGMREKTTDIAGITVIEDCYNASPDSIKALCETLKIKSDSPSGVRRKIAVIADMLELGDYSHKAHTDAGKYIADAKVDLLMTYGPMARVVADSARENGVLRVFDFDDKAELTNKLISILRPGDVVAFKGSRGMKLEDVIEKVYESLKKSN